MRAVSNFEFHTYITLEASTCYSSGINFKVGHKTIMSHLKDCLTILDHPNIAYKNSCSDCDTFYVDQTERRLGVRAANPKKAMSRAELNAFSWQSMFDLQIIHIAGSLQPFSLKIPITIPELHLKPQIILCYVLFFILSVLVWNKAWVCYKIVPNNNTSISMNEETTIILLMLWESYVK